MAEKKEQVEEAAEKKEDEPMVETVK